MYDFGLFDNMRLLKRDIMLEANWLVISDMWFEKKKKTGDKKEISEEGVGAYLVHKNEWHGYDTPETTKIKVWKYISRLYCTKFNVNGNHTEYLRVVLKIMLMLQSRLSSRFE